MVPAYPKLELTSFRQPAKPLQFPKDEAECYKGMCQGMYVGQTDPRRPELPQSPEFNDFQGHVPSAFEHLVSLCI